MWKAERKQLSFHENQSIGIDPDESILQTYITTQYNQGRIPAMLKLDGACGKPREETSIISCKPKKMQRTRIMHSTKSITKVIFE